MELAHNAERDYTLTLCALPVTLLAGHFLTQGVSSSTSDLDIIHSHFKPPPSLPSHQAQNSKSQPPQNHPVLQAEGNATSPGFQATLPGAAFTKQWLSRAASKKSHLAV